MIIRHIRWQLLIALVGMALLLFMLSITSNSLEMILVPEPGGTYIEGISTRPDTLNPLYLQNANQAEHDLAALLFNGMTTHNEKGQVLPDLATRWDISSDHRIYTFFLRDDVFWHDNTPFTAQDIAFTVGIIQDPNFTGTVPAVELWRTVKVEVIDSYTIRFILPVEVAPFAPFLSFTTFGILPQHILTNISVKELPTIPFSRAPVGTGPWRILPTDGTQITLEPHLTYFGRLPLLERLILRFYDDSAETLQALNQGKIMGMAKVEPADLSAISANPELTPYSAIRSGYTAIFINLRHPFLESKEVRQALLLGLDRQTLISNVLDGQGFTAHSFLMPTHWAYEPSLPKYEYEPEQAIELLKEAGWTDKNGDGILDKNGKPLEFSILTIESNPQLVKTVEETARQWNELGIKANPQIVSNAPELRRLLEEREFDLFVLATPLTGLPSDPDFYPLWHSSQLAEEGGQNYTSFVNEEADLLLTEGRLTLDQEKRRAIYSNFQEILARELPALPLYHPIYNYVVSDIVKNVRVGQLSTPSDRFLSLPEWYIKIQRIMLEKGEPTPTPFLR